MKRIYLSLVALFVFCTSGNFLKATVYYLKSSGNVNNVNSWGQNTDGSGTAPANFTTAGDIWHFANRSNFAYSTSGVNFLSTHTVIIETNSMAISGTGNFGSAKIDVASNCILNLNKSQTYNFNSLAASSTVVFTHTNLTVKAATYGNVTIAASIPLDGSAGDIHIAGLLTINASRVLTLAGAILYLEGTSGSIAGSGTILSDAAAAIGFANGNGGNNGTLTFSSGSEQLFVFDENYSTGSDYITLGSDLTITGAGVFSQSSGGIDLNGHKLTIDNTSDASFPSSSSNGAIKASGNSALDIEAATFASGSSGTIFFDPSNKSIKSFTLNSPGNTLTLGNALNVTDNIDVTDGTFDTGGFLTLKADATRAARLGPVGGTISGTMTVETFAPASAPNNITGWAMLGANGIAGKKVSEWETQIPMTCFGCIYSPTIVGGFESIQGWDESTGTYITGLGPTSDLTPGVGFWVYLGSSSSTTTPYTWSFGGTAVTGATSVPLSSGASGMNLIANPYASPISWDAVAALNGLSGTTIYGYNADTGTSPAYAQGGASSSPTGIGDVIPAGQGFYFDNFADALSTLNFDESVKTTANTMASNPLIRQGSGEKSVMQMMRLKLSGNGSSGWVEEDYALFDMRSNTSLTKGPYDAYKIFQTPGYQGTSGTYSKYTTISSKDPNGVDLSINAFPPSSNRTNIPVLVRVAASGTYTMSAQDYENWPSCIVIKDKLDNSYHDLTKGAYAFSISDTTSAPRFELVVCETGASSVLSVKELMENNKVNIGQDKNGAFVKTAFEQNTKATISVYNIIGQQIQPDVKIEGTETNTRLDANLNGQVVIVKVATDKEVFTKKLVVNQ